MFNTEFHVSNINSWQVMQRCQSYVPEHLREALNINGSLTRFIEKKSGVPLRVEVLGQALSLPLAYERQALSLPTRRVVWLREVILSVGGVPWIYARTVVPLAQLAGHWRLVRYLGNRPIGNYLFRQANARRSQLMVSYRPLPSLPQKVLSKLSACDGLLWARYSKVSTKSSVKKNNAILISEYFLPEFLHLGEGHAD